MSGHDPSCPDPVRVLAFWSINDRLDSDRLRSQLLELRRYGYDGVVFHPRFFPDEPPYLGDEWMRVCSRLILDAKDAGMEFWIYDENGWPSGSCGGELLRRYPDARQYWVEMSSEETGDPEPVVRRGDYLDMLDPVASAHFIEMTYDRYRSGLNPRAFEYVTGFFTDEPQYGPIDGRCGSKQGFIPWTLDLPRQFESRYGQDLWKEVQLLFFDRPGCQEFRVNFWELVIDLHHAAFQQPLSRWCAAHGKELTGHAKGEEHPLFQLMYAGSCPQFYRTISLPGIDSLERHATNAFAALELRSAARQFGDGRCMVEAFGGAGWGAGPGDLLEHLCFYGNLGLTHFVLHQSQYRLKSNAVSDWPPSIPFHVPWAEAFPDVLAEFRRRMAHRRDAPAEALLVAPHRGVMARYEPWIAMQTNIHNGSSYPECSAGAENRRFMGEFEGLRRSGLNFDVTDERVLEQFSRREGSCIRVGRAEYKTLILSRDCVVDVSGRVPQAEYQILDQVIVSGCSGQAISRGSSTSGPLHEISASWRIRSTAINNSLVLEPQRRGAEFVATFSALNPVAGEIIVLDEAVSARLNGARLSSIDRGDNAVWAFSVDLVKRQNTVTIRLKPNADARSIFAYLVGRFTVRAHTPYCNGAGGTLSTSGPFHLDGNGSIDPSELVQAGYPFIKDPVVAEATIRLPSIAAGTMLHLKDCRAAAAHLMIGSARLGWMWGPSWQTEAKQPIAAGEYLVQVTLAPPGLNFYGPHHHVDGDLHGVSEAQFLGRRNFLDRQNAPEITCVPQYHFLPFGLGIAQRRP